MIRRIGTAIYRVEVLFIALVGAVLAVPVGYLGILLKHEGLVATAAMMAAPFILLLMPLCVFVPMMGARLI